MGRAKRVRFKGKHQLDTVEGKSNETGLVWRTDRVVWRGVTLPAYLARTRPALIRCWRMGWPHRVKYVRLVRRRIGARTRYFAPSVFGQGRPYQKPELTCWETARWGSICGRQCSPWSRTLRPDWTHFCAELDAQAAAMRREQRHLDRQRRANNPYRVIRPMARSERERAQGPKALASGAPAAPDPGASGESAAVPEVAHRKSLHGRLAHQIVRQGSTFLLEKVSYRAWQRQYGRSVQRRAPGTFVQILTRLAERGGGKVITVPTQTTKLSQTCQVLGR